MRALLASLIIGVSVFAVSDVVNAQKGAPAPSAPVEQCITLAEVRSQMPASQATERAYLEGDRARPLLAELNSPPGAVAALIVTLTNRPGLAVIVLFDARGCASGTAVGPDGAVSRFLGPQT